MPDHIEGKHYRYSHAFDQSDPDGDQQLSTEQGITAALADSWTEESLEGMAWWIVKFVAERFCQPEAQVSFSTLLTLQKHVETYLADWMQGFETESGPGEDEAKQAGKELPLLVLAALCPEYITGEERKGAEECR